MLAGSPFASSGDPTSFAPDVAGASVCRSTIAGSARGCYIHGLLSATKERPVLRSIHKSLSRQCRSGHWRQVLYKDTKSKGIEVIVQWILCRSDVLPDQRFCFPDPDQGPLSRTITAFYHHQVYQYMLTTGLQQLAGRFVPGSKALKQRVIALLSVDGRPCGLREPQYLIAPCYRDIFSLGSALLRSVGWSLGWYILSLVDGACAGLESSAPP